MDRCDGRDQIPPASPVAQDPVLGIPGSLFHPALYRCGLAFCPRDRQSDQPRGHFSPSATAVHRGDRADARSDGGADRFVGDHDHGDGLCGRRVDHVGGRRVSRRQRARAVGGDRRFHRHRARDRRVERRLHGLFRHAFVSGDADHHDVLQRLGHLVHRRSTPIPGRASARCRRVSSRSALAACSAFPTPPSSPS